MNILVTGGRGRIGAHLCQLLKNQSQFNPIVYDIEEYEAAADLGQPDAIIHLAAQSDVNTSMKIPIKDASTNIGVTLMFLEHARRLNIPFVYASSGGSISDPRSPYALSKKTGAEYTRMYRDVFGVQTYIGHIANVYGPGMGGVVKVFSDAIRNGDDHVIFNGCPGDETDLLRDYTHVDDVTRALMLLLESGLYGGDMIETGIGTGKQSTVRDVLHAVESAMGRSIATVRHKPAPKHEARFSPIDNSQLLMLGWRARPLQDGLDYLKP